MTQRSVRRRRHPRRVSPRRDNAHRVPEQVLLSPYTNRRLCRSLIDKPWLNPVVYMVILLALLAPSHVADFGSTPNLEPYASTATPISHDPSSISPYIRAAATRYDVSEKLITAVIAVESEFNPYAVSRRGATGLMQLMPGTAATVGVRDRLDAPQNIDGGVRHLRALMDRFSDNLPLVLAAYNAGEHPVAVYGGIPPYPETRRFVVRVLRRLGDRHAVEKMLAQSAPQGRRGQDRRASLLSASSHETAARAAVSRHAPDPARRPNAKATSQEVANTRTGDANGKPAGESSLPLSAPRQQLAVPGAIASRTVIQAP